MSERAKLIDVRVPKGAEAAVIVAHGGGSREGDVAVSPAQLSVLRMVPISRAVARAGRGRLAVFRLLNSTRGWNARPTPVDDLRWACEQVAGRLGGAVPLGLVGHSLGGRAAVLAADQPDVRSVAALAPWVYPEDGRVDATGVDVLVVHGTADRIAAPDRSARMAELLRRSAASLTYVRVDGGKHAMLSRHEVFSGLAADFTAATLLDPAPARAARTLEGLRTGTAEAITR